MKVLLVTNMRPSPQQPYSGIFVINQYHKLRELPDGPEVRLFSMERRFTGPVGSLVKYVLACFRFVPHLFSKYDIVHLHFFYPLIFLVLGYRMLHRRSRVLVTFHGSDVVSHIHGRFSRRVFSRMAKSADYLITVSYSLASVVESKLGIRPQRVLCAGVDRSVFYRRAGIEKRYDFIFAGSLTRLKGADLLIDALELLHDQDIRVCIAGTGPYMDRFAALRSHGRLEIMGRRNQHELRELFNQSRFLVMPSRQESFGLVVTEAMYCGTPAIASRIGGITEQIEDAHNGLLIPGLTPQDVMSALERGLALPAEAYARMSEEAARSNGHYSLESVIEETTAVYRSLAPAAGQRLNGTP